MDSGFYCGVFALRFAGLGYGYGCLLVQLFLLVLTLWVRLFCVRVFKCFVFDYFTVVWGCAVSGACLRDAYFVCLFCT